MYFTKLTPIIDCHFDFQVVLKFSRSNIQYNFIVTNASHAIYNFKTILSVIVLLLLIWLRCTFIYCWTGVCHFYETGQYNCWRVQGTKPTSSFLSKTFLPCLHNFHILSLDILMSETLTKLFSKLTEYLCFRLLSCN